MVANTTQTVNRSRLDKKRKNYLNVRSTFETVTVFLFVLVSFQECKSMQFLTMSLAETEVQGCVYDKNGMLKATLD